MLQLHFSCKLWFRGSWNFRQAGLGQHVACAQALRQKTKSEQMPCTFTVMLSRLPLSVQWLQSWENTVYNHQICDESLLPSVPHVCSHEWRHYGNQIQYLSSYPALDSWIVCPSVSSVAFRILHLIWGRRSHSVAQAGLELLALHSTGWLWTCNNLPSSASLGLGL